MAKQNNVGFRISKAGFSAESDTLSDFVLHSQYQSLMLLSKVTRPITITSGACSGSDSYSHGLGYPPFTLAYVTSVGAGKVILPFYLDGTNPPAAADAGKILYEDFSYTVTDSSVTIDYEVKVYIPMMGATCPSEDISYSVDLYLYALELGSEY